MMIMTLLTSQLANVAICVSLAAYKRYPILLWALLGTMLPVTAPIVILCAPRLAARSAMPSSPPLMGWILLSVGTMALPQMLIGLGFSVDASQRNTSVLLLLLSAGAIVAGSVILRRRSTVGAPAAAPTAEPAPSERALHRVAAVAVVIAYGVGVWMQLEMLVQRRVDLLAPLSVGLLPFVLTVYLLKGRHFARPLLIAFSIYSLPLGLGLMTGLGARVSLTGDTRIVVETVARLVVLTTLVVAALLGYWRRRNRTDSGALAMESAT